jgi:5-methylcytosine-specific restriction endonuclease McrA
MSHSVGHALRRQVAERAGGKCEYCLTPEWILLAGCEVDHVVSRKHGGITDITNLALACARCNRAKGSDIGSTVSSTGAFCRLFNPRTDRWNDHFSVADQRLAALTDIADVTIRLLRLNDHDRLLERALLQQIGEFPS